jgi:hypothetical protein
LGIPAPGGEKGIIILNDSYSRLIKKSIDSIRGIKNKLFVMEIIMSTTGIITVEKMFLDIRVIPLTESQRDPAVSFLFIVSENFFTDTRTLVTYFD